MTAKQMCITTNKFCAFSSRLASPLADLMSKNGRFGAIFATIVLKVQDGHQCANQVSQMRHFRPAPDSVLEVLNYRAMFTLSRFYNPT